RVAPASRAGAIRGGTASHHTGARVMPPGPEGRVRGERLYAFLLRLYPPTFRARYGDAMIDFFREQRRGAGRANAYAVARLWLRVLADLARTAIGERAAAMTTRRYPEP